tara:strand:- start:5517 stop:5879 length:363 start_codon:yes stop_codon:yes gene_type:complete
MPRLRFACKVENGQLVITNRSEFDDVISKLNGNYYIELKETGVRSAQQNNYYWAIVDLLANDLGYTNREMHDAIKTHFEIESTKILTTKEFSQFIERIIRWSAIELGVVVPDSKTLLQSS